MGWDDALGLADKPVPTATTAAPADELGRSAPARPRGRRNQHRRPDEPVSNQRRDIQGLRAVAVVIVVINHMFDQPKGGFLGVDVFFVISGYLITGLLLREEQRTETLSMLGFYKRRIRRLFPSALTVTVLTVVGAFLLFGHDRFVTVVKDAFFATVFGANWRFIHTGTDYFAAQTSESPLQHYWSLSVEEQYYVVWPIALLIACFVARKLAPNRQGAATVGVLVTGVVLVAASAVIAFQQTSSEPVVAYFSTFTRGWELGIGSLLAVIAPAVFPHLSRVAATLVSWVGLVMVVVSFFVIGQGSVPMPGAVLSCVGAALVILGWSERGEAVTPLLTNPVAVYLGDISYSVYVVHLPVIILATTVVGDRSPSVVFKVTVAFLALGLSMLLYHLIEDPIRRSTWLTGGKKPKTDFEVQPVKPGPAMAFGLLLCVAAFGAFVVVNPPSPADERFAALQARLADAAPTPSASPTATGTTPAAPTTPAADALQTQLTAALQATSWPTLDPAMGQERSHDAKTDACVTGVLPASECTWGNPAGAHTLYLVGDSTAVAFIQGFVAVVAKLPDWKLVAAPGDGCPWTNAIPGELNHNWPDTCTERNAATVADIQQTKPDLLVVTHGHTGPDYLTGIGAQLQAVKDSAGQIVLMPNGPPGLDPGECYNAVSSPADCISQPDKGYNDLVRDSTALAAQVGGVYVDPTAWFCVDGNCPGFVGTMAIRFDQAHLTDAFSAMLGPVIYEEFQNRKLFDTA